MAQILMPDGRTQAVDPELTTKEVITQCVDGVCPDDYALIFFGHKLRAEQRLKDAPHFEANCPFRLVRQHTSSTQKTDKAEVDKMIRQCRHIYENLGEELLHQLDLYMLANKGENFQQTLAAHPQLFYDPQGLSVVKDMCLLVPYVLEHKEFPYERPHVVQILKKALHDVVAKNRPSTSGGLPNALPFPRTMAPPAAPSGSSAQNAQLITPEMLNMALAQALGGTMPAGGGTGAATASEQVLPPSLAPPQPPAPMEAYATQLAQLHEWGFMDDAENMQALMLADGSVEQAMQILIAMREDN